MPGKTVRRSSYQSSNTTTMLFDRLQRLREQQKDTQRDIENVKKTIDLARAEQKKYLSDYDNDNWSKSIKKQMTAVTKKNALDNKIEKITKDIINVRSQIQKGGKHKIKTRKKLKK